MKKLEIWLDADWFKVGDTLENGEYKARVISTPKLHYSKWYWRLLNFLTFRKFFNVSYTYGIEIID